MLAFNSSHTYAIFNYELDGLQWSGNAVIGYMSGDKQFFYNHPLSQTAAVVNVSSSVNASNTGIIGQLIYSLSGDTMLYINQTVPTVVPTISTSTSLLIPINHTVGTINSTATDSTSKSLLIACILAVVHQLSVFLLALPTATLLGLLPNESHSTDTFVTDDSPTTVLICSETLHQPFGFIISPGYPDYYPNSVNCMWTSSLETSHQIIFTFNNFALDKLDMLFIYDNSTENGSLIFSRSGQCATNATSFCPQNDFHSFIAKRFSLQFKSDLLGTSRGFNITYDIQQIGQ